MKAKTSPVWTCPVENFRRIVQESNSVREILHKLGLRSAGGNFNTAWGRIKEEGLEEELRYRTRCLNRVHLQKHTRGLSPPLASVMVKDSSYRRGSLKKRLIASGILENECAICHLPNEWNGQPLVMVLDHINGVHNDCRRENLRLLCPNCNSQQPTFAGRGSTKIKRYGSLSHTTTSPSV